MAMDLTNPVLVTALYDIDRSSWEEYDMSMDVYLIWMERTLSIDANIVIYTEEKLVDKIEKIRKKYDVEMNKTKIISKPLNELDAYKQFHSKLEDLMFSENFKNQIPFQVPEATKPLYNIIMFNKVFFLEDCVNQQYFNNDVVVWVDAGGLREEVNNFANKKWPSLQKLNRNKDKFTFFSHELNVNIFNEREHSLSQTRYIQGTSFVVPSHLAKTLREKFTAVIEDCLTQGYIGSDEKVFDLLYCQNSDLCELIVCGWREYFRLLE